jgi:hypothetical protein
LQDGRCQLAPDFLVNVLQHVPDFLVNVLQHVELQQRLGSCSLVCSSWRSAAVAATPDISITLPSDLEPWDPPPQELTSLEAWLRKYGRQASSLAAAWGKGNDARTTRELPVLHLPCHQLGQLQTLKARGVLLLPDAAADPAAAAAAAGQAQPAHSPSSCQG